MKKISFILVILIMVIFLLLIPSAPAISVMGQQLSPILYVAGKTITNHYVITDTNYPIEVLLKGQLIEYINISEVENNQFDMTLSFPEKLIDPGIYTFTLSINEAPGNNGNTLGTKLSVNKNFQILVYSNEKELEPSFSATSVNINETVQFTISLESRGYQDIERVNAEITVYDTNDKELGKIETKEVPLPALEKAYFRDSFKTEGLPAGIYHAKANVFYDGKMKSVNTSFKIGAMELLLKNYTSTINPGFNEFKFLVENNWGNPLGNVYAKLFINDTEILQTPTIALDAWKEGELKGIARVDLLPGIYLGRVQLFYEDQNREMPLNFTVVEIISPVIKEEISNSWIYFSLGAVLIILLIIIIILLTKIKDKR